MVLLILWEGLKSAPGEFIFFNAGEPFQVIFTVSSSQLQTPEVWLKVTSDPFCYTDHGTEPLLFVHCSFPPTELRAQAHRRQHKQLSHTCSGLEHTTCARVAIQQLETMSAATKPSS